jgi:uncharacterized repeat protein (TIGR01451 family)
MSKLVLWMSGLVVVISLLGFSGRAWAQNVVTPTLLPAPPGKLTIVNNGPGDQTDPHVSGNLVSYSSATSATDPVFTIHTFDLSTGLDVEIPQCCFEKDLESDVSGSTVVFLRISSNFATSIFSFDTATAGAQPVEVSPMDTQLRASPQIGGNTIAWEAIASPSSNANGQIIAYDIPTGATTLLSNDPMVNQAPAISPDGSVVTWEKCAFPGAPCDIWSARGGGTTWVIHQLTNGNGSCKHPDTNGQIVVYSCDRGSGDQLFWQPVTGGTEETLAPVLANESSPSIAGQFVSFAGLALGAFNHDLYVLDLSTLNLYQITNTPSTDEELSDISIASNGNVNVAWPVQEADYNIYAYSFSTPVADLRVVEAGFPAVVNGSLMPYAIGVKNLGPDSANNVLIEDPLPAGVEYLGTAVGNCSGPPQGTNGTVTCNVGTLASGANSLVLFVVRVNFPPTPLIANTVNVSSSVADPNPANNSATFDTNVTYVHYISH